MLIDEGIADALRHLDARFQSLVISPEKEKMTTVYIELEKISEKKHCNIIHWQNQ